MKKFLIILVLFSYNSFAQLYTLQSDSHFKWQEVESTFFKVVFPDYLESEAQYILNLLNYYRDIAGKDFESKPDKLTVILRPDMAAPNGFVTLAPRRSEFFTHKNLFPFVGSLEFYQTLAIHEYRHIVQYDFLSKGYTRFGYYLFGEIGLATLMNIVAPKWFFEGDAVWAETAYTDGGRGRSPRFMARLKALVMSDQNPKFDDLLYGDFEVPLINHYVYGYVLITYGKKKYGEKIWRIVGSEAANRPYNLLAMYSAFEDYTGQDFDAFYREAIQDLKTQWGNPPKVFKETKNLKFQNDYFPTRVGKDIYKVTQKFNGFMSIYKNQEKIDEVNNQPLYSTVDFNQNYFVYIQENVDHRYFYKTTNDLMIYNHKTKTNEQISFGKRYYHPRFHPSKKLILAILKNDKEQFELDIVDYHGKLKNKISLNDGEYIAQASWLDQKKLAVITNNKFGEKHLGIYDLESKSLKKLSSPTKNNLYNLTTHQNKMYFEADYQGKVNIFSVDTQTNEYAQCTDEYIGAYTPSIAKNKLYFTSETAQGKRTKSIDINCKKIMPEQILSLKSYISKGPSDNFTQTQPVLLTNHASLYKPMANKLKGIPKAKDHSELSGGFLPHSWSFLGGRGFQLGVTAQNELGTLGTSAAIGSISGEGTGFASLGIDYRKYVPIYSFGIDRADRNFLINGKTSSWTETKSYFGVNIPFFNSPGFYNELLNLQINTGIISSTDNDYTSDAKLDDETLIANSIGLTSSYQKALRYQGIQPEWGYTASLQYTDLSNNDSGNTNFLGQYNFTFYTPGFLENHGFNFNFTGEFGPENEELYQLQNEYVPLLGYLFSRGYATEFTSKFDRVSLNYVFPIAYPKFGFSDWIYFPRVYAQAFVDYTKYRNIDLDDRTLGSYGTEFIFDTNILRKIPMSFALRFLHNQREGQNTIEFYISNVF